MSPEFQVHLLTAQGVVYAQTIAEAFDLLLTSLATVCPPGREFSVCKTKLEEACFFAKKSLAALTGEVAE